MLHKKQPRSLLFVVFLAVLVLSGTAVTYGEEWTRGETEKPCYDLDHNDPNANNESDTKWGECPDNVPTPEPVSILLFSVGLAGVGFAARRRLRLGGE